jgi:hypothetical protein
MSLKELLTPKRCPNSFASKKTRYTAHQGWRKGDYLSGEDRGYMPPIMKKIL